MSCGRPAFDTSLGSLSNCLAEVSARCSTVLVSVFGSMLYTEKYDQEESARVRKCWHRAQSIHFKRILEVTHRENGTFFMLPGDETISSATYVCLLSNRHLSAAHYYKWHDVRRFTERRCTCYMFLKFAKCHHMFAAQIHLYGGRVIPPGAQIDFQAKAPPDNPSDHEEEALNDDPLSLIHI